MKARSYIMSGLFRLSNWSGLIRFQSIGAAFWLSIVCFVAITSAQVLGQGNQKPPRRPLPKPANGSRGFEQYAGKDASNRLIASGATRGGGTKPTAIAPMEGLAYDAHPFFKWQAVPNAKSYHFTLRDANDSSAQIVYQTDVATPQMLYPLTAPALESGKLYSWRVSTKTDIDKIAGTPVSFFILAGEDAAEVKSALAKFNLVTPQTTAERVRQAQIFEQFGVWYDALRDASEAINANPQDTAAKAYYEALVNRLKEAEQAKDEGDGS